MNFTRRISTALLILVTVMASPPAQAEDDVDGVTLSGLHAVPVGSVAVATAAIALRRGMVDLTIATQAQNAAAVLNIEGPAFRWLGEQDAYPDRQFPELQIRLDHHDLALQDHSTASFAGTDIADDLRQAGIDQFTISQSLPVLFPTAQNQTIYTHLSALGAIKSLGGQDVAAWSAQRSLSFKLPGGAHLVTITYKARPAITLQPVADLPKILPLATYCLTARQLQSAAMRAAKHGNVLAVQYAIPVGIDGNGGGAVALDLADPGGPTLPASIALFCGPNGQPVAAPNGIISTQVKPDNSGIVHILALGS